MGPSRATALPLRDPARSRSALAPASAFSPPIPVPCPARALRPSLSRFSMRMATLLVLDKPAGLVVHPAPGNEDGTLVNALLGPLRRQPCPALAAKATAGDRAPARQGHIWCDGGSQDRTGARHPLRRFCRQGPRPCATSRLVLGLPRSVGTASIEGCDWPRPERERKRMAIVAYGGKPALTHYRHRPRLVAQPPSLLSCKLATGRTHQIRVHLGGASATPWSATPPIIRRIPSAVARKLSPTATRGDIAGLPASGVARRRYWRSRHPRTGAALRFETARSRRICKD